jgi:hypothetical protein
MKGLARRIRRVRGLPRYFSKENGEGYMYVVRMRGIGGYQGLAGISETAGSESVVPGLVVVCEIYIPSSTTNIYFQCRRELRSTMQVLKCL